MNVPPLCTKVCAGIIMIGLILFGYFFIEVIMMRTYIIQHDVSTICQTNITYINYESTSNDIVVKLTFDYILYISIFVLLIYITHIISLKLLTIIWFVEVIVNIIFIFGWNNKEICANIPYDVKHYYDIGNIYINITKWSNLLISLCLICRGLYKESLNNIYSDIQ